MALRQGAAPQIFPDSRLAPLLKFAFRLGRPGCANLAPVILAARLPVSIVVASDRVRPGAELSAQVLQPRRGVGDVMDRVERNLDVFENAAVVLQVDLHAANI